MELNSQHLHYLY